VGWVGATAGPVAAVPAPVLAGLRVRDAVAEPGGGSSATVWRVGTADGRRLAVKVLAHRDGLVDGHDLGTFVRKPRQIAAVRRALPGLRPYYTEVLGQWRGDGWAAYAMPAHDGRPITAPLDRGDVGTFLRDATAVFGVLTEHGYARRTFPAPPDHFTRTHLDRIHRRLPLLRAHLPADLFADAPIVVNGRRCAPLSKLLDALAGRAAELRPARLGYPVHGDLNLGNLLLRNGSPEAEFTVLDPRGVLAPWDPVYDFGKALFSLTVFERAIGTGFAVHGHDVAFRDDRTGYATAAAAFPDALAALPYFRDLDRVDPGWRTRLAFAHACHCLAEAACRLSDRRPRVYGAVRGADACVLLATGLLLHGIRLLDELLNDP
jgi:aminoglycoside phosphotransferase (APT) family kinase protein